MIRSVGAGSAGLSNQTRRKSQPEANMPFPKINGDQVDAAKEGLSELKKEPQPMMVGVKPKAQLTSIFEENGNVMKLNADGDRLEVSKRAITLAKETLFG